MRFADIAEGCLDLPASLRPLDVAGIACDSRQVRPGYLFVAVCGEKADGHLFASLAEAAGAVAVVGEKPPVRNCGARKAKVASLRQPAEASRREAGAGLCLKIPYLRVADSHLALARLAANFYGRPQAGLTLAGVTGTKGKTTTSWVLDGILRSAGKVTALIGTVRNRVGENDYPSSNTTPSCLELLRYFHELRREGGAHAVLEVSSHGIAQRRIEGLGFRCGILTNVAPEHLDYHETFEKYLETKASFFAGLKPDAFAVLPREEVAALDIAARTRARVLWYGAESQDGVERVRMDLGSMSFRWKGVAVRSSRFWGHHNLLNLLAAMTAAECLGLTREEIAAGVESAVAPPGRLEEVEHPGSFRVFVDYAHTDGALESVLGTLRGVTAGRLITVFGCGGDRDKAKRPRMGCVAERWSDQVVITSDNPRSEDPDRILEEISRGLTRPEEAVFEIDRREAIGLGIRMARENDTILIAGKGHETYQELKGVKVPFDDREVAREFLLERTPF